MQSEQRAPIDNKATMRRFIEDVQEGGRLDMIDKYVAEDYVNHTPPPGATTDREGMRKIFADLHRAFPDIEVEVRHQVADGDTVVTYKAFHGTHTGEWRGLAPSGERIEVPVIDIVRFRDGKMTDHWAVLSEGALFRQRGLVP